MFSTRNIACGLYLLGTAVFSLGLHMDTVPSPRPVTPLQRGLARGRVHGYPRLDPDDPMANAAILKDQLDEVPYPGPGAPAARACVAAPRSFAVLIAGRLSWVHFSARTVCQLDELKRVSLAQPGFGEVGAFIVGRRLPGHGGRDVDVTRVVVPPFRFTHDTLSFLPADLGPLVPGERMLGTYHTHPDGDVDQGALSEVDLHYMRNGFIDFHGQVGALWAPDDALDWLFDVVDPQRGGWNVYAHDAGRLDELRELCESGASCPINELRLAGSRFYLQTRYYDERVSELWEPN